MRLVPQIVDYVLVINVGSPSRLRQVLRVKNPNLMYRWPGQSALTRCCIHEDQVQWWQIACNVITSVLQADHHVVDAPSV